MMGCDICHQTFRAARSDVLRTAESDSDDEEEYEIKRNKFVAPIYGPKPAPYLNNDDEAGPSRSKCSRQFETVEEVLLPQVHHEFLIWEGCNRDAKSRLGLYLAVKLDEEGFNIYFKGGLHSDEHFNAQEYWVSISREENLSLSRSHVSAIQKPILRLIHMMITYGLCQRTTGYDKIQKNDLWLLSMFDSRQQNGYANVDWLIARWMKRKGSRTQKESQICCGQFITKLAMKLRVLTDEVIRNLSTLTYCRDLDTTTLRELIDSKGRMISENPQPGVLRVGIPRPLRASMHDLYDMMGSIEICQQAIERMEEPITHLVMLSHSMISIISSTHLHHHSIHSISSSSMIRVMSSVEMTQGFKDEGLLPLMFEEDVIGFLEYVPRFREVEVYIETDVSLWNQSNQAGKHGIVVANVFYVFDSDTEFPPPWSVEISFANRTKRLSGKFEFRKPLAEIDHEFGLDNSSQDSLEFSNDVNFDDVIFDDVDFE
ncbi:hypothetical protein Tco_1282780 [Tanacetum coccineum]